MPYRNAHHFVGTVLLVIMADFWPSDIGWREAAREAEGEPPRQH